MGIKKYQPELGMMKECGAGQYVKLYDYRDLEKKFFDSNVRISELEKQLESARRVIEFYGDYEDTRIVKMGDNFEHRYNPHIGKKARQWLEENK